MKQELRLVSVIPPSVNHYLSYRVVKSGSRYIACSYKTKEAVTYQKEFEKYVAEEAEKQHWSISALANNHVYVDTIFYFPRRDMDCNNYFKVMLDAITNTEVVWKDDNIVCERVQAIYYNSKNPHIEMLIHPVEYIGIFDNNETLNEFVKTCEGCCRYSKKCSVLRKAREGYIQEGVCQNECPYFKNKKE